jgi:transposase
MKEFYCGVDIHKESFVGNIMEKDGAIVREGSFKPTKEGAQAFLCGMPVKAIAIEACGIWRGAYNLLTELGYKVKLANPVKTNQIACKKKTDKVDAKTLADLLRTNYLPEIFVPNEKTLALRDLVRHKSNLTRLKVRIQNKIKGYLLRNGTPYQKKIWNEKALNELRKMWNEELNDLIDSYWFFRKKEQEHLRKIGNVSRNTWQSALLITHPGIGEFGGLMMMSEIADVKRFADAKHLLGYAGLVPGIYQSADKSHSVQNHAVNKWLKWIVTECSSRAAMFDKDFMALFAKVKKKKGFKVARREIARKMLRNVYFMLKNEEPYHAS